MKLYGIDDEIILSGANLSGDYFTDRQDRYHLFKSPQLTRFYERLQDTVSSVSYSAIPCDTSAKFKLVWQSSCPEPTRFPRSFKKYTTELLQQFIQPAALTSCEFTADEPPTTIVYPLIQLTPLLTTSQSTEQPAVNALLEMLEDKDHSDTRWVFTAGYFNVFADYRARLLRALGNGTVITASPDANGFYKSRGPSGMLAAGYTLLSRRFLVDVGKAGRESMIKLREWRKGRYGEPGRWTYHAKGIWVYPKSPFSHGPSLTFIGSSNLTRRSQALDLEATALVITADPKLQQDFAAEVEHLLKDTKEVTVPELSTPERKADLKTRIALWLCQGML